MSFADLCATLATETLSKELVGQILFIEEDRWEMLLVGSSCRDVKKGASQETKALFFTL